MEWREALEDARHAGDVGRLASLACSTAAERDRTVTEIGTAIDQRGDHGAAVRLVRQLMFIQKFGEEVRTAEELLSHPREASA
jgi:molecular chaperone HscB